MVSTGYGLVDCCRDSGALEDRPAFRRGSTSGTLREETKRSRWAWCGFAATLLLVLAGCATGPRAGASPVDAVVDVFEITSEEIGQSYRIKVASPSRRLTQEGGAYPVVYLLDSDMSFDMVRQILENLAMAREVPPTILVGVGYPGGLSEALVDRDRDYTPTVDEDYARLMGEWRGQLGQVGGASEFLTFLENDLMPAIERRYPADPEDATVVGHSFGGLLALFALLESPSMFERYLASSPALWWDDDYLFARESAFATDHSRLPVRLFVSAGGWESWEKDQEFLDSSRGPERERLQRFRSLLQDSMGLSEYVESFAQRLERRRLRDLQLRWVVFPEETHASVTPAAISRGVRYLFGLN